MAVTLALGASTETEPRPCLSPACRRTGQTRREGADPRSRNLRWNGPPRRSFAATKRCAHVARGFRGKVRNQRSRNGMSRAAPPIRATFNRADRAREARSSDHMTRMTALRKASCGEGPWRERSAEQTTRSAGAQAQAGEEKERTTRGPGGEMVLIGAAGGGVPGMDPHAQPAAPAKPAAGSFDSAFPGGQQGQPGPQQQTHVPGGDCC
jgi:hypothetical protein